MTRRIKKQLKEFFESKPLTLAERNFILGCIAFQEEYPQLTSRQWQIVLEIKERHNNE